MSKMSELDAVIRDLRTASAAINEAADTITEMSSRGFTAQVKELLRKHGAATLSGIDPSEYAVLIKDAEGLGNG